MSLKHAYSPAQCQIIAKTTNSSQQPTPITTHPVPVNNQTLAPTHPISTNNQTLAPTHPIPANNQTPVLTYPMLFNNQTPLLTHQMPVSNQKQPISVKNQTPVTTPPMSVNNQTPLLTQQMPVSNQKQPIPANNQTPVLTYPMSVNNQTPLLTQQMPLTNQTHVPIHLISPDNQTPVLTHPIPGNNQTPLLIYQMPINNQKQPIPANNQPPKLIESIPANNQIPVLIQQIPVNNQTPILTHPIPANNQTPVLIQPIPADNQSTLLTHSIPTYNQTLILTHPIQTNFLGPGHSFSVQPNIPLTVLSTINTLSLNDATAISNVLPVNPMPSAPIDGNNTLRCKRGTYSTANLPVKALADSACDQDAGVSSTNFTDTDHLESNLPTSLVSRQLPKNLHQILATPLAHPAFHQDSLSTTTTTEKCSSQAQDSQASNKNYSGPKHWSIGMPKTFRQLVEATCIPVRSKDNLNTTPPADSTPCSTSEDLDEEVGECLIPTDRGLESCMSEICVSFKSFLFLPEDDS